MDFTIAIGSVLVALPALIGALTVFLQRRNRSTRRRVRQLEALVEELNLELFTVRQAASARGVRLPARSPAARALELADDDPGQLDPDPAPEGPDAGPDEGAGGGARHRAV